MDRTYRAEMAMLEETFAAWERWRREAHFDVLRERIAGPVAFVASGGSLAVAHLGAALHQRRYGHAALVLTPLELACNPLALGAVFVISDSASHPDALLAVDAAHRSGSGTVVIVSNRPEEELRERFGTGVEYVSCPRPGNDGWIATNSVLSLSLGMLTMYDADSGAPAFDVWRERWLTRDGRLATRHDSDRDSVLCLHTPGLRNVAVDLETRTAEAGLGSVTATDLRNLGHGRHVGLLRNQATTALVILAEPSWMPLVRHYIPALPPDAAVRIWTGASDDWSPIELLLPSAGFLASRAAAAGADPGNPEVSTGGLGLFRMRLDEVVPDLLGRGL